MNLIFISSYSLEYKSSIQYSLPNIEFSVFSPDGLYTSWQLPHWVHTILLLHVEYFVLCTCLINVWQMTVHEILIYRGKSSEISQMRVKRAVRKGVEWRALWISLSHAAILPEIGLESDCNIPVYIRLRMSAYKELNIFFFVLPFHACSGQCMCVYVSARVCASTCEHTHM